MRFQFFEYVFFVSAFGTLAFFPAARDLMPLLALPAYALNVALIGITALVALALYEKNHTHPTHKKALIIAAIAGCVALLISILGQASSIAFAAWSLNATLAVFTFGSILARRFFRRVERDFRRNMVHVLIAGLAINTVGLFAIHFFTTFPPIMMGIFTAIITFIALI